MMGELPNNRPATSTFEPFAERWFAPLVGVFLRSVRDPALAYDLATETLAAAWLQWDLAPRGDDGVDWLLRLAARVLDATVERMAPPPHVVAELRLSGLVEVDPLPDHEREPHGT
jgi:hypothetical protein